MIRFAMARIGNAADFGQALRNLREMHRLTQRALFVEAQGGFTRAQLCLWETGRSAPSLVALIRLAHALGYDLALVPKEDA